MRADPRLRSSTWLVALVILATACGQATEASRSSGLQPGRYALTTIDGAPLPFELSRNAEGRYVVSQLIGFDTITVLDDSTARQHLQTTTLSATDGTPDAISVQETSVVRRILARDDEFVLIGPADSPAANAVYLSSRGDDLIQLFRKVTLPCAVSSCQSASRVVEGRYVRR